MNPVIAISNLNKTYANGHQALKPFSLEIQQGEILAMLGPNGAGKTTLISIICGIVNATGGSVKVNGLDTTEHYRETRSKIGLVPQELTLGAFDKVTNTLRFSRGLFGKKQDDMYLEQLLKDLSLWDKKDNEILALSGGMKRRVLIAKALAHEPDILFLDEPTAGVDVELRKEMWELVRRLQQRGVTIILTTHYIEEAEEIADRVAVINKGELLLVDDKENMMHKLGTKQMLITLDQPVKHIPESLENWQLELSENGLDLCYSYDARDPQDINKLISEICKVLAIQDINTKQSTLEEIFVNIVNEKGNG